MRDEEPEGHQEMANEFRLSKRAMLGLGVGAAILPVSRLMGQTTTPTAGVEPPRRMLPPLTVENADAILRSRFAGPNACLVAPQTVEGPYYIDGRLMRSDIREKQVGETLVLRLQVVDANSLCAPLPTSALVSVWQCNAQGFYSGYHKANPDRLQPAPGDRLIGHVPEQDAERWLRGVQATDKDGWVTFTTIFPGWYTMRVPHIHVRVLKNEREMATTQVLFPQTLINNVLVKPPYAARGPGIITNENDLVRLQSNMGPGAILDMQRDANGVLVGTGRIGLAHG